MSAVLADVVGAGVDEILSVSGDLVGGDVDVSWVVVALDGMSVFDLSLRREEGSGSRVLTMKMAESQEQLTRAQVRTPTPHVPPILRR